MALREVKYLVACKTGCSINFLWEVGWRKCIYASKRSFKQCRTQIIQTKSLPQNTQKEDPDSKGELAKQLSGNPRMLIELTRMDKIFIIKLKILSVIALMIRG